MELKNIDLDSFIDKELKSKGLMINLLSESLMRERLNDIMTFENNVRLEYKDIYTIEIKDKNYFLNPMDRKFSFSYYIENENKEIINLCLVSVYIGKLHVHSMFTKRDYRSLGLGKLAYMKICKNGYDNGFKQIEGYRPLNNNGSIILGLKLGLQIINIRNETEILMSGDIMEILKNAYYLYIHNKCVNDKI